MLDMWICSTSAHIGILFVLIGCDDPLPARGVALHWQSYRVGTMKAKFSCNSSYASGTAESATCKPDGTWATSHYKCLVSQYVSGVSSFSSEWKPDDCGSREIIGEPDVYPTYGDISEAFLPRERTSNEYIHVVYPEKLYVVEVHIYETYHAGSVFRLDLKDDTQWVTIWQTASKTVIEDSRIFKPPITPLGNTCHDNICPDNTVCVELTSGQTTCALTRCDEPLPVNGSLLAWQNYRVGTVNASFQCSFEYPYGQGNADSATCKSDGQWAPSSYTCIEELVNLYVDSVSEFSSQYSASGWSADKIIGPPDVYPAYKYSANAYVPLYRSASEYISVHIYETYHGGAVYKIDVKNNGIWEMIWETTDVEDLSYARIFKPPITPPAFKSNEIKIHIDYTVTNSYTAIDAVKILGNRD